MTLSRTTWTVTREVVSRATITDVVSAFGGTVLHGDDFWPDGALDSRERIAEIPKGEDIAAFMTRANEVLDQDIQHIAESPNAETFLYYQVDDSAPQVMSRHGSVRRLVKGDDRG